LDGRLKIIYFSIKNKKEKEKENSCKKAWQGHWVQHNKITNKMCNWCLISHVLKYSFELINIILGAFIQ
jgi:hypothetical protein